MDHKRLIISSVLILVWAFSSVVRAEPDAKESPRITQGSGALANGLTLRNAIGLAMKNNPDMRAYSARIDAAAGRAYQSKFWSNPELTLSAEDWPSGGGGFSEAKKLAGVEQAVPFPGKKKLDRDIGAAEVRITKADASLRRVEMERDVKVAFFQVLAAERLIEESRELARVAESSAATANKRVVAGAAADQEKLRAEILLEQARTVLSGYEHELATARQNLSLLIGLPDLAETSLIGALAETADLAVLDQGPERWLAAHPVMVGAKTSREKAELELRRARLEPYPDVKFGLSGGQDSGRGGSIVQLGLSLPLPIIDRSKGKKQEARANRDMAAADAVAAEHRLLRAWSVAGRRLRTAADQAASYRERIMPKANEALQLVQTGFEQGKFGFIDLLDTQRTTAEVRLAYQQKLLELNIAQAELDALAAHHPGAALSNNIKPANAKE
jgi:cobalt-zinc-cadmium efflux system outer membrane protein